MRRIIGLVLRSQKKEGPVQADIFAFLATDPSSVVAHAVKPCP